jgi:NitT/TauT family transport system permease protein
VTRVVRVRILVIAMTILVIEALCRSGIIDPFTMIPPSRMFTNLGAILTSGALLDDIALTLSNVAIAFFLAITVGFVTGAILYVMPRVRRALDPLLASYYAIPIFVFYPLFIVLLGLNRYPQIMIGFLLAVVAMIINTLNGFDRVPKVLLKTARVHRLGRVRTTFLVFLPYATLYIFTGLKLAVAYSFIGVIAAEFVLSGDGMGYEINFAYNNFDNQTMYPLILLIIIIATAINMSLYTWEKWFRRRQTER